VDNQQILQKILLEKQQPHIQMGKYTKANI